jgi:hypothetical protein
MFNIDAEPRFTDTVTVHLPGGKEETFKATFRVLPVDDFNGFDLSSSDGTRDFLKAAIAHLDELVDASKTPVAYSAAVRDQVIGMPHVRLALVRTYVQGIGRAIEGN